MPHPSLVRSAPPRHGGEPASAQPGWIRPLLRRRSVRLAALGWLAVSACVLLGAEDSLPFEADYLASGSTLEHVLGAQVAIVEVLALMGVVAFLTRHREPVDLTSVLPDRVTVRRETIGLLAYVVAALVGGLLLARVVGWHPFGLHLAGTIFGTHDLVTRGEALGWAAYNLVVYVVVPLAYFGRKHTATSLLLRSRDRRGDARVIGVVLLLEFWFQMVVAQPDLFSLEPRVFLLGTLVTFTLYFAGAVLPAMVVVYCLLVPRYRILTGSTSAAVILGGLTYTLVHVWDAWTVFSSPQAAVVSVSYLLLTYLGPGMIRAFLTLRTGNAWVHVWGYHAFAPHTLIDTPHMVEVFRLR